MTSIWRYSAVLVDTNALRTVMNFIMPQDEVSLDLEFAAADAAMLQIKTTLGAITDANFYRETLSLLVGGSAALPADADITDEAAVLTYLTGAGEVPKFHLIRVPAPIDGLFLGDGTTVDDTVQALIDYISDLESYVEVSDGEVIDTSVNNGISYGFWRSVKKSSR